MLLCWVNRFETNSVVFSLLFALLLSLLLRVLFNINISSTSVNFGQSCWFYIFTHLVMYTWLIRIVSFGGIIFKYILVFLQTSTYKTIAINVEFIGVCVLYAKQNAQSGQIDLAKIAFILALDYFCS